MKLTILGSCSGTEPMPDRKHTSFAIEHKGAVYVFDAGEGCSYTAHLLGIDLLKVRAIFISHTHMDHVGGLANLLWTMRKLDGMERDVSRRLSGRQIDVFIPNLSVWEGILQVLAGTEGDFKIDFDLEAHRYGDGIVFDNEGLRVTALHNLHLGQPGAGEDWTSFSFLIEVGGKRVVYSGDVRDVSELGPLLDGCDLLLMETGHHKVAEVCAYLRDSGKPIGQLGFVHHGREILGDAEGNLQTARDILGDRVFVADDGMSLEI